MKPKSGHQAKETHNDHDDMNTPNTVGLSHTQETVTKSHQPHELKTRYSQYLVTVWLGNNKLANAVWCDTTIGPEIDK